REMAPGEPPPNLSPHRARSFPDHQKQQGEYRGEGRADTKAIVFGVSPRIPTSRASAITQCSADLSHRDTSMVDPRTGHAG
ncbi:hypothetical protein ACI394_28940, partial [Klebsiella pneumoniae]|uniref:hypothetical protein n=1 Tax=Klebsiella pneumoniae TaxID=573 RepID=UPI0038538752